MACHPSDSGSYTVVIIPLRTSLYSLDALRFYLWTGSAEHIVAMNKTLGPLEDTGSTVRIKSLYMRLQIKQLKNLEKEKDTFWSGLNFLEKARIWYLQQLEANRAQEDNIKTESGYDSCQEGVAAVRSYLLRSRIQRVNGCLGSVMSEPIVMSSSNPSLPETMADSELRWHNTVLTQEVTYKNHQISMLELEKDALLEELDELQAY